MSALTVTTTAVRDGQGQSVNAGTCTEGTHQFPAVGVVGADGAAFQPAMDAVGRPGYFVPVVGGQAVDGNSGNKSAGTVRVVLATDQPALANAMPVGVNAGENHVGEVGGRGVSVAVEFVRPADTNAYAVNDVVSDSTSATTVQALANFARVNGGTGYVTGARLTTDKKSVTARFRVHLFNASNPTVAADNVAMKRLYADESKYLGSFDLPAMSTPADTTNSTDSVAADLTIRVPFVAGGATRSIYYVLETLDAFTPASGQKFTLRLNGELD
jgi:hypothetical protein